MGNYSHLGVKYVLFVAQRPVSSYAKVFGMSSVI